MARRREMQIDKGDPLIPILNLVCMLIPLLLYGAVFVKFKVLDVKPPRIVSVGNEPDTESLQLKVFVTDQGFHIKVNPQFRKAWMADESGTPDIPRKDDGFDFEALQQKIRELKNEHRTEQSILIGAEDDVAYEVIIKTMDFTRGTPEYPLFPDVRLTRSTV
ncbi:MAG: biopolymer transporter ExbD [Deltaproteobacteria bacterium]|nr:biopolymer transporter ExbD [Deltaproteobacteria bacterium]MBN2673167.1 biopolymer transporter ExbD [Deltaproteobacteria bacterium]